MADFFFFFFKQKTAYEITYGDWSSDVCSSDLGRDVLPGLHRIARQVDHRVAHAHLLRGVTARDDERVEIGHARRSGREIRRDHCLSAPALELRSGRGTD